MAANRNAACRRWNHARYSERQSDLHSRAPNTRQGVPVPRSHAGSVVGPAFQRGSHRPGTAHGLRGILPMQAGIPDHRRWRVMAAKAFASASGRSGADQHARQESRTVRVHGNRRLGFPFLRRGVLPTGRSQTRHRHPICLVVDEFRRMLEIFSGCRGCLIERDTPRFALHEPATSV